VAPADRIGEHLHCGELVAAAAGQVEESVLGPLPGWAGVPQDPLGEVRDPYELEPGSPPRVVDEDSREQARQVTSTQKPLQVVRPTT
jgi:hypothetical protein